MFLRFLISIFIFLPCFFVQADQERNKELSIDERIELRHQLSGAVANRDLEEVQRLVEAGVDINADIYDYGFTALHAAASMEDHEFVQGLMNLGANPHVRAQGGVVPMHYARDLNTVKTFESAGVDPRIEDDGGNTALLFPSTDNLELARFFVEEAGISPNKGNKAGFISIHHKSDPETVKYLLEKGADPNMKSIEDEYAPIHTSRGPTVQILLDAGANPNARSKEGWVPLHFLSVFYGEEKIRRLLEAGANPDARSTSGDAPLHSAAIFSSPKFSELLLEAGANPNVINKDGDAPIHLANTFETGKALIEGGANPNLKDKNGDLPRIVQRFPELLEVLPRPKKGTSCEYTNEPSQISPTQCGRKNVCMAEVSCTFKIGAAPNTTQTVRNFQAVCSSLSNGQCPEANDCVLDRSVVETEKTETENRPSSSAAPQSSSGTR